MASIKGYELKNVKTFQGLEWTGVQGSIYYKGKKVGWYNDSGNGGMADIELRLPGETVNDRQKERENQLESAVKKYYAEHPLQGEYAQLTPDAELFFGDLIRLAEDEKYYKKIAKSGYGHMVFYKRTERDPYERYTAFTEKSDMDRYIGKEGLTQYRRYDSPDDFVIR